MLERRTLVGHVVSNKMDKTVVVVVETVKRHPVYHRIMRRHKRYKAHDQNNVCLVGDIVRISEHKPISKDKRWLVREVLGRKESSTAGEIEREVEEVLEAAAQEEEEMVDEAIGDQASEEDEKE